MLINTFLLAQEQNAFNKIDQLGCQNYHYLAEYQPLPADSKYGKICILQLN